MCVAAEAEGVASKVQTRRAGRQADLNKPWNRMLPHQQKGAFFSGCHYLCWPALGAIDERCHVQDDRLGSSHVGRGGAPTFMLRSWLSPNKFCHPVSA